MTYLDTNIVIFLHGNDVGRITGAAIQHLEGEQSLLISGMVLLELEMLYDKGKIAYSATEIVSDLATQIGLTVCQLPMAAIMHSALGLKWTRDPGDRIIVANAIANGNAPLLSSDRLIKDNYASTVW